MLICCCLACDLYTYFQSEDTANKLQRQRFHFIIVITFWLNNMMFLSTLLVTSPMLQIFIVVRVANLFSCYLCYVWFLSAPCNQNIFFDQRSNLGSHYTAVFLTFFILCYLLCVLFPYYLQLEYILLITVLILFLLPVIILPQLLCQPVTHLKHCLDVGVCFLFGDVLCIIYHCRSAHVYL